MAEPDDLRALYALIFEARTTLDTAKLPDNRAARAIELLTAALALADDMAQTKPAAALGAKGGAKTAERGPEYFKKIAGMRKTKAGGRPRGRVKGSNSQP
jgi:hypothetical protein